jgi:hypothetical protein
MKTLVTRDARWPAPDRPATAGARLSQLLEEQPVLIDAIETSSHSSLGVSIFDVTEALRFGEGRVEADLFVHTTYVLMQNHEGWRLAHIHCSPANAVQVAAVAAAPGQALH